MKAKALERGVYTINATVTTSKWETERVNAGVSGVGSYSVSFKHGGKFFSTHAHPTVDAFINETQLKRVATGYRDDWTGATCGIYSHETQLTCQQVKSLLARVFEYDGQQPLNPFRFRERMVEAIRAYARIENQSVGDFLDTVYPKKSFNPACQKEYDDERRRIYKVFGITQ